MEGTPALSMVYLVVTAGCLFLTESQAKKCFKCVYYSGLEEGKDLIDKEKELSVLTAGFYSSKLYENVLNSNKCLLGPTEVVDGKIFVTKCPDNFKCATFSREDRNDQIVVVRGCATKEVCHPERVIDTKEVRDEQCCLENKCNNNRIYRAVKCHQCLHNTDLEVGETIANSWLKNKTRWGLSQKDVIELGRLARTPTNRLCRSDPKSAAKVICQSKICSTLTFSRGRSETIARDCLPLGKLCETEIKGGEILCCMGPECNGGLSNVPAKLHNVIALSVTSTLITAWLVG